MTSRDRGHPPATREADFRKRETHTLLALAHFGVFSCKLVCAMAESFQLCPTLCDPTDGNPPGSSVHGIFQAKNTGVGCHALLKGTCLSQGLNPRLLQLLHCRRILYRWAIMEDLSYKHTLSWLLHWRIVASVRWTLFSEMAGIQGNVSPKKYTSKNFCLNMLEFHTNTWGRFGNSGKQNKAKFKKAPYKTALFSSQRSHSTNLALNYWHAEPQEFILYTYS